MNVILTTIASHFFLLLGIAIPAAAHSRGIIQRGLLEEVDGVSEMRVPLSEVRNEYELRSRQGRLAEQTISEECLSDLDEQALLQPYKDMVGNMTDSCPDLIKISNGTASDFLFEYDMTNCDTSTLKDFCKANDLELFEYLPFTATCKIFANVSGEIVPRTTQLDSYYVLDCFPDSCPLDHAEWSLDVNAMMVGRSINGNCTFQFLPEGYSAAATVTKSPLAFVTASTLLLWMGL